MRERGKTEINTKTDIEQRHRKRDRDCQTDGQRERDI